MKLFFSVAILFPLTVLAVEADYTLLIRDHRFQPAELTVPAGMKIKLVIDNQDDTQEEFDSHDLNREKLIAANSRVTLYIGPLSSGRYLFDGELHEDTAQGVIIVK
jgi:hypothetical protein